MIEKTDAAAKKDFARELISANKKAEEAADRRLNEQKKHYEDEINVLKDQADRNMEAIAGLHDKLDKSNTNTHDTGVRIYRNVQAAIVEENEKQTKQLLEKMEALSSRIKELEEKPEKSNTGLTILLLLGVIANLVLTILMFTGFKF